MRTLSPLRPLPSATPILVGLIALGVFAGWLRAPVRAPVVPRVPGADRPAGETAPTAGEDVFAAGVVVAGPGKPAQLPGSWPRFRGALLDGISRDAMPLARSWPGGKPRELWSAEVGEGYAGPVIAEGRVYLMDYDREKQRDALRCLSLADGAEIWRFSYPMAVKRNHGLTRTVPALAGRFVVAMGPKCHVLCVEAGSGKFQWGLDLVKDRGTTVPPWYTGQCPLVDGDAVILAPGGPEALMLAVDLATGQERWRTPNPNDWKMTHSSVVPFELEGRRYFLYCASGGVVAVSAGDGAIAWETGSWKINIATVPSPVLLDNGRVFLTGGYNAGCLLLQFKHEENRLVAKELWRAKPDVFGATQHSPVWWKGHLYGIRADGRFVCLGPDGKVVWASGPETNFGLGPLILAGDLALALNDSGRLTLLEANAVAYQPLAEAQIMDGHEAWAPLALAGDRLLARDMTRMVCLHLGP
jgi:outer membrane protein assembly factor BamB